MSNSRHPMLLAGALRERSSDIAVANKFNGALFAHVSRAEPADIEAAIAAAAAAEVPTRELPAFERERILRAAADEIAVRRSEFVETLIAEAGKPRKYAEVEVSRTIDTFAESARRASDLGGEYHTLDQTTRGRAYRAVWRRFPLGPVACITPFNFPLNLVAHKVGPAMAAGCPFVVKPASATPLSALMLGGVIVAAGWPANAISVLPCRAFTGQRLAEDERMAVLSFTGSAEVGWGLRARAGRKRVVLELGGNAAAIVHGDADLADAARRCAVGGFAQAGQSCISVQRILVDAAAYEPFKKLLLEATATLNVGDPALAETDVGPMISEDEAKRVETWVGEAAAGGARILLGGKRAGAIHAPTIIENPPSASRVNCCEVFGPVVTLAKYESFDDALRIANESDFGLQAGVFTRDISRAWQAYEALDVGGVIINDVPTFRAENMPYGGAKASGCGREGVRFAIDDYTEWKTMVVRT